MTVIHSFLIGTACAFVVSLAAAIVLRPHIARLLEELCGSRGRAGFWMIVSLLCIFLVGMLGGTTSHGYPEVEKPSALQLFFGLITQVRWTLIGLLASLLTIAWLLLGAVRRFEQGISPAARSESQRVTIPGVPR